MTVWPENAEYGSQSMHQHFAELVNAWNAMGKTKGYASTNESAVMTGATVINFLSDNANDDVSKFIEYFKLDDFVIVKSDAYVQLNNSFNREDLNEFFAVLDDERTIMLNDCRVLRMNMPTLNDVYGISVRTMHRLDKSIGLIRRARIKLGEKFKLRVEG